MIVCSEFMPYWFQAVLDPDQAHCAAMVSMYQTLLTNHKTNLAFKVQAIGF